MNINVSGLKQDYSFLFSNMNSSANSSSNLFSSINLSDYNSIKTGSYGKLLKAYYKKETTDTKDTSADKTDKTKTETTQAKEWKDIQTDATALQDSAAALMQKGSRSVFKDEDMEKIYSAVSDFVKDYNTLVEKGYDSSSSSVIKATKGMTDLAKSYENELKEMGITIDKDHRLSVDKDAFMSTDVDQVKDLFHGQNSFSYLVSMRAVSIENTAYSESNKSSLYNGNGSYTNLSAGDLFDRIV